MKAREGLTKPSESDKVDAYMGNLKHPLASVAKALRDIIRKTDPAIGEEIKWNAPAFFLRRLIRKWLVTLDKR